ncbi:MAG TPA: LON peptidase substrate-binding domain-containing protein [Acidimicrobiales bacterium]|nr:LON peptidase substrate-binding domain-containing protein [Acidimicrobiales bacterium]
MIPLPMFPLGTVLFPHAVLPLHVFEERYRTLVADCLETGHEFGVVLIERGSEVGGGDTRFPVGTVARIREATPLPDGRWILVTYGTRRIRVATWLPDDPYPVALVEDVPEPRLPDIALRAVDDAARLVRRALSLKAELGEPAPSSRFELDDDVHAAAWQLAALAPLSPVDHQRLLETDDPEQRLTLLTALAQDAGDLLAYRLSPG